VIAHLRGRLLTLSPELAVVDVGGVGYAVGFALDLLRARAAGVPAPRSSSSSTPTCAKTPSQLYGFLDEREQALFEKLITVSGIGPRLAMTSSRACPPRSCCGRSPPPTSPASVRIPGVGKKTAERMVARAARQGSRSWRAPPAPATPRRPSPPATRTTSSALVNLGYRRPEAENGCPRRQNADARPPSVRGSAAAGALL
jgi:holliday junction DNA helicase RuvA